MTDLSAADALARAVPSGFDKQILRVALTLDEQEIIAECILAEDVTALREASEFFELAESDLPSLLDEPFKEKTTVPGGKPFWPSRFSNGDFAVYYASRADETAAREYGHHLPKRCDASLGRFEIRVHLIRCRMTGSVRDLYPLTDDFPDLVVESHDFCQKVGGAAKEEGLDGLLTKSVRHPEGTNVPILERSGLTEPEKLRDIVYEVDSVAKTATFRLV